MKRKYDVRKHGIALHSVPLKKSLSNSADNSINHHKKQRLYMDSSTHRAIARKRNRRNNSDRCVNQLVGLLHCYNVFLLILGAGVLGLGIWMLVKDYSTREIAAIVDSRLFEYVTYALVAGGGTVAILAFCGCCGTMRQDKYVLGFYGTVLFMVLGVLVGGSVIGIIFRTKITEGMKRRFEDTLEYNYNVDIIKNSENRLLTDAWDAMQRTLECCGPHGNITSRYSWAFYKGRTTWYLKRTSQKMFPFVPESCCRPGWPVHDCQGINSEYDGIPVKGPDPSVHSNPSLYTNGCYDKAIQYLEKHSLYIAIVAGAVPVFLIAGIVISFYLCANVSPEDEDDDDDDEGQEAEV
ncbi:tetraspanin-18-like isoform X2 [Mytilus californianus]|uniref:tetraspanin-18-like isoform X2 n=1 Tax=Mytilus californianus TaxID=6549 RepID=UPI002245A06A|nr:tetraspanin-18-like isoform X2 [Mytilus californianus]